MSEENNSNAIERTLSILELVTASQKGLSNADLSRRLNIPKSSASYILRVLEKTRLSESGRKRPIQDRLKAGQFNQRGADSPGFSGNSQTHHERFFEKKNAFVTFFLVIGLLCQKLRIPIPPNNLHKRIPQRAR